MEETATLYAMLANRGRAGAVALSRRREPASAGPRLLSEEASFMTLDMLQERAASRRCLRARAQQRAGRMEDRHVVGLSRCVDRGRLRPLRARRVGRQLRRPRQSCIRRRAGGRAAVLPHRRRDRRASRRLVEPAFRQPPRLERVDVCSASGDLPNAECPQTASTWYIPGVSPIRVSQMHRRVWIDTRTGEQACPPYDPAHTRSRSVRILADRSAATVRAGRHAATPPAAAGRLPARRARRHAAAHHLARHCRDLHDARGPHRQRDRFRSPRTRTAKCAACIGSSTKATSARARPASRSAGIRAARGTTSCAPWTIAAAPTAGALDVALVR